MLVIAEDRRYGNEKASSWPTPGTSGVYGLCDPRNMRIRYIGSSHCIEHRLYAHVHCGGRLNNRTPRGQWVRDLAAEGVKPVAVVLQHCDVGPRQGAVRHEIERQWIETYALFGDADLNVHLTPIGHGNSMDTPGKKLMAEVVALRKRVAELEQEIASMRGSN